MRIRVHVPNVIAPIAAYVADPEHALTENAFELTMRKVPGGYAVDGITRRVKGEASTVHTPKRPATAHTHNIKNYKDQQCHVGWPSGEDMHWVFALAVSRAKQGLPEPVVHLCSAVEATYIIVCWLPRLAELSAAAVASNGDDILAHFASAHGHRCERGADDEDHPCGSEFVTMAHAYRFTGKQCERHAGERARCVLPDTHRREAARLHSGPVFCVGHFPHDMYPDGKLSEGHERYCRKNGPRHLRDINFGKFDHKGSIRATHTSEYVDVTLGPMYL